MRPTRLPLLFALALSAACADAPADAAAPAVSGAGATAPARPAKLGLCVACHGEDGVSRVAGTPHLGGQDGQYLRRALEDYRSGARRHVPMSSLANSLQPADIEALAAWYASRPGFIPGSAP